MRVHARPTLKEYIASMGEDYGKRLGMKIMPHMTDQNEISTTIANMHWEVRQLDDPHRLLTSDRPVRRDYPFKSRNAVLTVPIGPQAIFMAAHSSGVIARLFRDGVGGFMRNNNRQVVRQARQFAIAYDDRDRQWVPKALAKEPQPGFFDFIRDREPEHRKLVGRSTRKPTILKSLNEIRRADFSDLGVLGGFFEQPVVSPVKAVTPL
ncbi:hypothetical protein [Rhizobium sp. BR 362]|uniref:hypothetical protein n=1 Tax=Rhizobium sp. BR 362 TaxID=3040670 RepID=UPI002F40EA3F